MKLLSKIHLKLKDPEAYKNKLFRENMPVHPQIDVGEKSEYHFKHSGNAGDIIYALPAIFQLSKNQPIHLHLQTNQPGKYGNAGHPLGNVMMNKRMIEMLSPLLLAQPDISTCDEYLEQHIDYDLDYVRKYPFQLNKGNIIHWYYWAFGVRADESKPWLNIKPDHLYNNAIVLARSKRYNAPGIQYSFLVKYERVVFIGVEEEYELMKKQIPELLFQPVKNFYEMAMIIAGSKLFIGNQSFPFAIAEAIKVKRILEVYFQSPNVAVSGNNGWEFCFQPQFEKIVEKLMAGD
ncbi:MAG: hypothetical protein V4717_14260 [Bacteroidota bacterium]